MLADFAIVSQATMAAVQPLVSKIPTDGNPLGNSLE
jgi:hypothetical protein